MQLGNFDLYEMKTYHLSKIIKLTKQYCFHEILFSEVTAPTLHASAASTHQIQLSAMINAVNHIYAR